MGSYSYLQSYGVGDERRERITKIIIVSVVAIAIASGIAYLLLRDFSEKQAVKHFLSEVNTQQFQTAYQDWGCTAQHPCPNYNYDRFMQDWGPSKTSSSPWKIASVDGCKMFVTVNVQADGRELQSLSVARANNELGYAPAPECQEYQWHFKQFFKRIFGGA